MNIIDFCQVIKKFRIHHHKTESIKYSLINLIKGVKPGLEYFTALDEVSFQIQEGETLGIIGRNGSGKSTILKLISKILFPDAGIINVQGRVSALLELGSGFNPELTGIENIFLNSAILGFKRKEVQKRLEQIIAFAELERFIENPVKSYSSGMYMRLGFATAIHVDPDILLVDEILAVGDEGFQRKCIAEIRQFKKRGRSLVFVSHNPKLVEQLCDQVLVLEHGKKVFFGKPQAALEHYHGLILEQMRESASGKESKSCQDSIPQKGDIILDSVNLFDAQGEPRNSFKVGEKMVLEMSYKVNQPVYDPLFRVQIHRDDGVFVHGTNTDRVGLHLGKLTSSGKISLHYHHLNLVEGVYYISLGIWLDEWTHVPFDWYEKYYRITINSGRAQGAGITFIPHEWIKKEE